MSGLRSFVARRLLLGVVQIVAVVLLVFALTEALPGDAAVALAGDQPDPARVEAIRAAMELDRPAWERLADWAAGLLHGDLGTSLTSGRPVARYLADGFGPTLLLAALTVVLLVPAGVGLGVLAARYEGRLVDRLISSLTLVVYAVPEFALGCCWSRCSRCGWAGCRRRRSVTAPTCSRIRVCSSCPSSSCWRGPCARWSAWCARA